MLYQELSGSLSGDLPGALLLPPERLFDEAGRLRDGVEPAPEVLFEALDTLTVPVHHLLEDAVGVSQPNLAHHVLAGWLGRTCPLVITTNFDRGIEDGAQALGKQPAVAATGDAMKGSLSMLGSAEHGVIWKPHGSLSDPPTVRVTLKEVAAERYDAAKMEAFATVLRRFPMLVIGYSGYDNDLSSVFRACGDDGRRLWWLCLSEPRPTEPAQLITRAWGDRATVLVGDLEELLTALDADRGATVPPHAPGGCADADAWRRVAVRDRFRGVLALHRMMSLALIYKALGEYSAAADVFGRAADLAGPADGSPSALRSAVTLQRVEMLHRSGRSPEAYAALASATFHADLAQADGPDSHAALAQAFMLRGQIFRALGQASEAANDMRKAADLGTGSADGTRAEALLSMAALGGDPGQVRARLLEAKEGFEQLANRRGLMKVNHELAILALDREDTAEARQLLGAVVAEARELGDGQAEQFALHELAIAARKDRDWADASRWLDAYDAITAYRADADGAQYARALRGDIAVDEAIAADDGEALRAVIADLTGLLQEDLKPEPRALALRGLVWAAVSTGDWPLAEQGASRLAELARQAGLPVISAFADQAERLIEGARRFAAGHPTTSPAAPDG
jgi:tetratricopeptide (TPR) repeat protein